MKRSYEEIWKQLFNRMLYVNCDSAKTLEESLQNSTIPHYKNGAIIRLLGQWNLSYEFQVSVNNIKMEKDSDEAEITFGAHAINSHITKYPFDSSIPIEINESLFIDHQLDAKTTKFFNIFDAHVGYNPETGLYLVEFDYRANNTKVTAPLKTVLCNAAAKYDPSVS